MASAYATGSSDILPARTANGCDIKATQLIKTDSAPLRQAGSAAAAVQYLAEAPLTDSPGLSGHESPRIRWYGSAYRQFGYRPALSGEWG
jgi:hypothetical protein